MKTAPPPADAADLASTSGRAALPPSAKPYWQPVQPGLYLGYYKGARGASWYARRFMGDGKYKQERLGRSQEGAEPAAGALGYGDALEALEEWSLRVAPAAGASNGTLPRNGKHAAEDAAADAEDGVSRITPVRLDRISAAWAAERPDIDFWLAGFFLRLEYAHVLHERRLATVAAEAGVNVGDLHVLLALRRNGASSAMRPTDLFRDLLITSGAITKRLDRLKASRMIERVAAADDRRSELVRLTPAGRRVADAAMSRISASLAGIVQASGVSRDELKAADAVFRRLMAAM